MDDDARRFDRALIQLERLIETRDPAADVARAAHIAMQLLRAIRSAVSAGKFSAKPAVHTLPTATIPQ
jgi:hypothetical protein